MTFVAVEGAGHMVPMYQPEVVSLYLLPVCLLPLNNSIQIHSLLMDQPQVVSSNIRLF